MLLLTFLSEVYLRDWQSSNTFRDLPIGSYIVQGRDNCPSPTVTVRSTYRINARVNNVQTTVTGDHTACDVYTFQLGLKNTDGWLSFPVSLNYTITQGNNTIVSNVSATFTEPAGISFKSVSTLPVDLTSYNRALPYRITATGTDGCGKPITWAHNLSAGGNPFSANVLGACSNITIRDVIGMTSPVTWTITSAPAAYTGPTTGSEAIPVSGVLKSFTDMPFGTYNITLTDACGRELQKSIVTTENCSPCQYNNISVNYRQQVQGCTPDETILNVAFTSNAPGLTWRAPDIVEIVSGPAGYTSASYPVNISNYIVSGARALRFPTTVPGSYTFRAFYTAPNCTEPTTVEFTENILPVRFSDFTIQQGATCGVSSIDYNFNYNPTPSSSATISAAVLQRKNGNNWDDISTATAGIKSGSFNNIDVAGTYRVRIQKVYSTFYAATAICAGQYEYSNELVVTGSSFPTFTEAYGMFCAASENSKVIVVGGQNGRPWPQGYKYKITHFNRTPYNQVQGHDPSYLDYDFRQTFTLPDGTYTFSLVDICDNEISRELDITALAAPVVRNTSICENGQSGLVLSVDAFEQIGYQWFKVVGTKDAFDDENPDDLLVSTTADLTFFPLTTANEGEYYIRITSPGLSCTPLDIPYTLTTDVAPEAGTSNYSCNGGTPYKVHVSDEQFSLNALLNNDGQKGGTWTAAAGTVSTGWSGSTFTPSQSQDGTFNFTYTVEGVSADACNNVPQSSVCVSIVLTSEPLPVTLRSFEVKPVTENGNAGNSGAVVANWSTTEEVNALMFEVERSGDSRNWLHVGSVNAHGDISTPKEYSFTDISPLSGTSYYRLKMVDKDYTYEYSYIRSVERAEGQSVYPNPATTGYITVEAARNAQKLEIFNPEGQLVQRMANGEINEKLNVAHLPTGLYIIRVHAASGSISTHKVFIFN